MGKLLEELKRRKVFRVAAIYAVVAWVLIQVADTVLPALQMPQWTVSFVTVLFILGFIPTLIAAWAYEITPEGVKPDAAAPQAVMQAPAPTNQTLIYAIFVLVLAVAVFQVVDRFYSPGGITAGTSQNSNGSGSGVMRSRISLGEIDPQPINDGTYDSAISPDGTMVASTAFNDGAYHIRLRNIDDLQFRDLIEPIEYAIFGILFSPDNQRLLLDTERGLQVLELEGASLASLVSLSIRSFSTGSYTWLDNEWVVFRNPIDRALYRTSIVDKEIVLLAVTREENETFQQLARLPDSNQILATVDNNLNPNIADNSVYLVDLTTGTKTLLINNGFGPHYLHAGYIAFVREQALWVVPFDLELGETTGAPFPADISSIPGSQPVGIAKYSVSDSGRLIYREATINPRQRVLVWVDLDGNRTSLDLPPGRYRDPVLSPEGDRLAVTLYQQNGDSDLWVFNLRQNTLSKVTFSGQAFNVVWSLDGERLYYERSASPGIWVSNANGIGDPQRIPTSDTRSLPNSITPDGSRLIYMTGFGGAFDLNAVSLNDETNEISVLLASEFNEVTAAISPDGNWLAYTTNETGIFQTYLRPYPNLSDGKWQISAANGFDPRWSKDGNALYYVSITPEEDTGSESIYSVPLTLGATVEIGSPTRLVTGLSVDSGDYPNYDIHPDERQFIAFEEELTASQSQEEFLILVNNWFEELNRLAPVVSN